MATRFLRYDSDPILRKKCKAVLKVDDKIRQLLDDMLDTLHETENGAALAANQVGVLKRLVHSDYIFLFMQHFVLEYHKICQIERRTLCHLKSIC